MVDNTKYLVKFGSLQGCGTETSVDTLTGGLHQQMWKEHPWPSPGPSGMGVLCVQEHRVLHCRHPFLEKDGQSKCARESNLIASCTVGRLRGFTLLSKL